MSSASNATLYGVIEPVPGTMPGDRHPCVTFACHYNESIDPSELLSVIDDAYQTQSYMNGALKLKHGRYSTTLGKKRKGKVSQWIQPLASVASQVMPTSAPSGTLSFQPILESDYDDLVRAGGGSPVESKQFDDVEWWTRSTADPSRLIHIPDITQTIEPGAFRTDTTVTSAVNDWLQNVGTEVGQSQEESGAS